MDDEVAFFEQTILDYADAVGCSVAMDTDYHLEDEIDSDASTPLLSPTSLPSTAVTTPNSAASREGSFATQQAHRPSFATRLSNMLIATLSQPRPDGASSSCSALSDDEDDEDVIIIDG